MRVRNEPMVSSPIGLFIAGGTAICGVGGRLGWIWGIACWVLVVATVLLLSRRTAAPTRRCVPEAGADQKRREVLIRAAGQSEDIGLVTQDLSDFVILVEEVTQESESAANGVQGASRQVSDSATSVASAAEEMTATMHEVARSAAQATQVTSQADGQVVEVKDSTLRLVASMEHIDDVVRTIETIAAQTKLLALNATIEAARAGNAGKGFAIVAEEVKQLAMETDEATHTITEQLRGLVTESQSVRAAVEEISNVFKNIDVLQQSIAAATEEQSAVIAEITRSANQAAAAAADLDTGIIVTTEAARRTNEATHAARTRTERLAAAVEEQRAVVGSLLDGRRERHPVRAAITAHAQWKQRLRTAVAAGRVEPGTDLAVVARDDACDFGRWLHGEARGITEPALLGPIIDAHAAFHRETAAVLVAVDGGRLAEAKRHLMAQDGYTGAVETLTNLLLAWTRDLSV